MKIEFDPAKASSNATKHGVPLEKAKYLEWDMLLAEEDKRGAYGELRFIGFAPIGQQVFCVVFTDRGEVRRIISLQKGRGKNISSCLASFFARTLRCRKELHTISMRPFSRLDYVQKSGTIQDKIFFLRP